MHSLHCILVNVKDLSEEETFVKAYSSISKYVDKTHDYYVQGPGYFETNYPPIVYGLDHDRFKDELIKFSSIPLKEAMHCLNSISCIDSYLSLLKGSPKEIYLSTNPNTYYLKKAIGHLYGDYTFDSQFYDVETNISKLMAGRLEYIIDNANDYALVFVDLHY